MNRKNDRLPEHLDTEQMWSTFQRMIDHPEKPQSKRVERILDLMSQLRGRLPSLKKGEIKMQLDEILSHYRWSLMVALTAQGLVPIFYPADRGTLSADERWEYEAIGLLRYLGERPRIRRCAEPNCRRWFFAGKSDKKQFCSDACKVRVWDSKPENRERKRRNAKRARDLEKRRDAVSKNAFGYRSRVTKRGKARR